MDKLRFPAKLLVAALLFAGSVPVVSAQRPAQTPASEISVQQVTSATFEEAPRQVVWTQDEQAALIVSGDSLWSLPLEGDPSLLLQVAPDEEIVAISPTGLAAVRVDPFTVNLLDAASGEVSHTLALGAALRSASFSPDGRTLATSSTGGMPVQVWDIGDGTLVKEVSSDLPETSDHEVRFGPDGRLILSASERFQVMHIETGELGPIMRVEGPVNDVAFDPTRAELAVASDVLLSFWDESTGEPVDSVRAIQGGTGVSYAGDGGILAIASKRGVNILDMPLARPLVFLEVSARQVEFGPSGALFITTDDSGMVTIWRTH